MVKTLANAIERGRIAHAFLLTGVRGVGKTSTARLIAKALNCIGPDGQGGPTITPCGVCEPCRAIAEGRHIDVIEMDAASHTGVDDIREIIDAVRYASVSARYKIYIIDEVHMLSKSAFNALLKTLEEPPEHVKFLFATTEVDKVPVTVLSRCQRFDLRRIPAEKLAAHFAEVAEGRRGRGRARSAGDDRPGRRRLGARRPVDPRPGDRPRRGRSDGGAGPRHARPGRPRAHPAPAAAGAGRRCQRRAGRARRGARARDRPDAAAARADGEPARGDPRQGRGGGRCAAIGRGTRRRRGDGGGSSAGGRSTGCGRCCSRACRTSRSRPTRARPRRWRCCG